MVFIRALPRLQRGRAFRYIFP